MINLSKSKVVDLSKKAETTIAEKKLTHVEASVLVVLDVSKSMHPLYHNGIMQNVIERLLALAIHFDDDQKIDAYVFGTTACELAPLTMDTVANYIEREVISKHKINQATKYATAIELIHKKYRDSKQPVYVIFITDGDNSDKKETKSRMIDICKAPIFWQFVGIGKEEFKFLNRLDDLAGRAIDNAGFMHINDIDTIADEALYTQLLEEFPSWLNIVKQQGIIQ